MKEREEGESGVQSEADAEEGDGRWYFEQGTCRAYLKGYDTHVTNYTRG